MDAARSSVVLCIYLLCVNDSFVLCNMMYTSVIDLPQGRLKGLNLGGYNAYLGIPYASVPKRFHEAGPAPTWTGIFNAIEGSIKCSQIIPTFNILVDNEECLVVNIYTPSNTKKRELLPVMIFIHGGGFAYGSNTNLLYDAKYLVQKDVIVAAINYRLGAFGFLCLNETEATGNMGLKDQVVALRWINQNIKSFGGDPNLVTLMGESAGATSVHYLTLSDLTKGLFQRIIMESGSILIPIAFENSPLERAKLLVSRLGHNTSDQNEILKILQNANVKDILTATETIYKKINGDQFLFLPCAENTKTSKYPFITESPRNLLKSYKLDKNLSVIMGINNKEGIMFAGEYNSKDLENLEQNFLHILPKNLKIQNKNETLKLVNDIKELYFHNESINSARYNSLINFYSDALIIYPTFESIEFFLRANITMFNYLFQYDSWRNLNKFASGLPFAPGANHADELFYIFDPLLFKILPISAKDEMIIDVMTSTWTNFAKIGDPSTVGVNWLKSEINNLRFLSLGNKIKVTSLPFKERMHFWKNVYLKYAAY